MPSRNKKILRRLLKGLDPESGNDVDIAEMRDEIRAIDGRSSDLEAQRLSIESLRQRIEEVSSSLSERIDRIPEGDDSWKEEASSLEALISAIEADVRILASSIPRKELKDVSESVDMLRADMMRRLSELGGGSMNRQIRVNGTDVLTRYTDINLTGSITATTDNANRRVNIAFSSGGGTVTNVTATSPITSSGGTTPNISTSIATNRLVGRSTSGTGAMEEISVGTGLSLSGGTLSATGDSDDWSLDGNAGAANKKLGTTDMNPLRFYVNDSNVGRFSADGLFGVGTSTPTATGHFEKVTVTAPSPGTLTATFGLDTAGYSYPAGNQNYAVRTVKTVNGISVYSSSQSTETGVEGTDIDAHGASATIFGYGAGPASSPVTSEVDIGSGNYISSGQTINYTISAYKLISGVPYYAQSISTSYTDVANDGHSFNVQVSWTDSAFFDGYKIVVDSTASYATASNTILDDNTASGDATVTPILGYTANGSSFNYEVYAIYAGACLSPVASTASTGADANNGGTYRSDITWTAPTDYSTANLTGYRIINTTNNTSIDVGMVLTATDNNDWSASAGSSPTALTKFDLSTDGIAGADSYQFYNTSTVKETNDPGANVTDVGSWTSGNTTTPNSSTLPTLKSLGETHIATSGTADLVKFWDGNGGNGTAQGSATVDLLAFMVSLGLVASGAHPLNLNGGTLTAGIGGFSSVSTSTIATLNGIIQNPTASTNTTTGTINNLSTSGISSINFNGASAQTVTGFANPLNGKFLYVMNIAATGLVLKHEDTNSTAANRIVTSSGGDYTIPSNEGRMLQYISLNSRWYIYS